MSQEKSRYDQIEAQGHQLERDIDGEVISHEGIDEHPYHTYTNCIKCRDWWCIFCSDFVEPCGG